MYGTVKNASTTRAYTRLWCSLFYRNWIVKPRLLINLQKLWILNIAQIKVTSSIASAQQHAFLQQISASTVRKRKHTLCQVCHICGALSLESSNLKTAYLSIGKVGTLPSLLVSPSETQATAWKYDDQIKSSFFWQSSPVPCETSLRCSSIRTYLSHACWCGPSLFLPNMLAIPFPVKEKQDLTTSLHMFPLALTDYKWNVRECKLCISSTRLSSQLLQVLSQFCDKIAQVGCIWL